MSEDKKEPLDPYKTICVCYAHGKEVGRVPATAPNAITYVDELVRRYNGLEVKYEPDETGGLALAIHNR